MGAPYDSAFFKYPRIVENSHVIPPIFPVNFYGIPLVPLTHKFYLIRFQQWASQRALFCVPGIFPRILGSSLCCPFERVVTQLVPQYCLLRSPRKVSQVQVLGLINRFCKPGDVTTALVLSHAF